jgi:nucleoid DNA-binding protein
MKSLTAHIEYLLTQTDCVIVPGFGGFVLRDRAALFVSDGFVSAPGKAVSFNASLSHNDGLLAGSLMRDKGISFNEAMVLIDAATREARAMLQRGETLSLGSVGSFELGAEGELCFTPARCNRFALDLYGLDDLKLHTLEELNRPLSAAQAPQASQPTGAAVAMTPTAPAANEQAEAPDEAHIDHTILKRVCAVAAIFLGLLCISHPLDDSSDISVHHASLISSALLTDAILPSPAPADTLTDTSDETSAIETLADETSPVEGATPSGNADAGSDLVETSGNTAADATQQPTETAPMKRYYIVVGSYPTEAQAEDGIKRLENQGLTHVACLVKDNKYRLYIDRFTDKEAANAFLERFRAEPPEYRDAWLLAHKS